MRQFKTGATRDTDEGKLAYVGFMSPYAMKAYAEYMHQNRVQADGKLRAADNWKKGIPLEAYMDSMFRHFMDVYELHEGRGGRTEEMEKALSALKFNVDGYLHEITKPKPEVYGHMYHTIPQECEDCGCINNEEGEEEDCDCDCHEELE